MTEVRLVLSRKNSVGLERVGGCFFWRRQWQLVKCGGCHWVGGSQEMTNSRFGRNNKYLSVGINIYKLLERVLTL